MNLELSIVTIALNNPVGLHRTLSSVIPLTQRNISLEHIVIDSSPRKHANVRAQFERFDHLVWRTTEPQGIYPALNEGTRAASKDTIWHLHSGDLLSDADQLIEALELLIRSDSQILYSPRRLFFGDQDMGISRTHTTFCQAVLSDRTEHPGSLFKRSFFSEIGYFNSAFKLAADYELFVRAANARIPSVYHAKPFVAFGLDGVSSTQQKRLIREVWQIQNEILQTNLISRMQLRLRYYLRLIKIQMGIQHLKKYSVIRSLKNCLQNFEFGRP